MNKHPFLKLEELRKQNHALREECGRLDAEVKEIRQLLFAVVRVLGRVRIPAFDAEAVKVNDEVELERDESGDWFISYKSAPDDAAVKPVPVLPS
jgi:hypothetical protein